MTKLFSFFKEAWAELKQVTWLTTPQMVASTVMVIILSAFVAAFVFVVDKGLQVVIGVIIP